MHCYIVLYEDDCGLEVPYSLDPECVGALCTNHLAPIAGFTDRKSAQRAINISVKFAQLCDAQGLHAVDDFLGASRKFVKIRKVEICE